MRLHFLYVARIPIQIGPGAGTRDCPKTNHPSTGTAGLDRGGISNQLAQNPPFSGEGSFGFFNGFRIALFGAAPMRPTTGACPDEAVQATGPLPLPFTGLNLSAPTNISPIAWLPSNRVPQVSQYNLQVQRQLGTNQSLSLAYVGTYGSRLTRNYNANQQLFNLDPSDPTSRLFTNLGSVTVSDNRGKSIYNSLQAQYQRRFTNGLQFLGAFTWSKTIDDSCGALDTCAPQLYTNYNIERGLSEIDQPYRMSLSALYELPFGRGRRWAATGLAQLIGLLAVASLTVFIPCRAVCH